MPPVTFTVQNRLPNGLQSGPKFNWRRHRWQFNRRRPARKSNRATAFPTSAAATDIPLSDATVSRFLLDTVAPIPGSSRASRSASRTSAGRGASSPMKSTSSRAACSRSACEAGDRVGIWSPNRVEWLLTQFATARIGAGPGQHQSGLPAGRARIRAEQGRLQGADRGRAVQDVEVSGDAADARARTRRRASRARCMPRSCPTLRIVIRMGDAKTPGMLNFGEVMARGRDRLDTAHARRARSHARRHDADQHPVHQRHDRQSEGRDADASQRRQQRALSSRMAMRSDRERLAVHPGAAVSLLRHGAGGARAACRRARRWCSRARRSIPPRRSRPCREERCTALHGVPTMFIAELDHPRLRAVRPVVAAHRHHGRLAVPDRDDEARRRARCTCARSRSPTA